MERNAAGDERLDGFVKAEMEWNTDQSVAFDGILGGVCCNQSEQVYDKTKTWIGGALSERGRIVKAGERVLMDNIQRIGLYNYYISLNSLR